MFYESTIFIYVFLSFFLGLHITFQVSFAHSNISTLPLQNSTTSNITTDYNNNLVTYFVSIIPVICFGTTNVPIKKFDCGNGIFYNWVIACTLLISGFIVHLTRGLPPLYILPALGGLIGTCGQQLIPTIIKFLGIGMGVVTYSVATLLVGWVTSYLGLFGIPKPNLYEPILNFFGVVVCVISIVLFAMVKPTIDDKNDDRYIEKLIESDCEPLLNEHPNKDTQIEMNKVLIEKNFFTKLSQIFSLNLHECKICQQLTRLIKKPIIKRIIGFILGIIGGVFYGTQFIPIYIMIAKSSKDSNYSNNSLDYIFAFTIGAFCTQMIFIIVYSIISKNNPFVKANLILPAFIGGTLLSVAIILWSYVSTLLNPVISYPLTTVGSPAISLLWGLFVFKEIKGKKNLIVLTIGGIFMIVGVIFITLSNEHI